MSFCCREFSTYMTRIRFTETSRYVRIPPPPPYVCPASMCIATEYIYIEQVRTYIVCIRYTYMYAYIRIVMYMYARKVHLHQGLNFHTEFFF